MFQYVLKRVGAGIVSMLILITVTFFMMHAMPGSPFSPAEEKNTPPQVLARMEEKYGLNDPVIVQFGRYMSDLFHGDLGMSFKRTDTSVNEMIGRGFPVTARLGSVALVFSFLVGIPLGIVSALNKNKAADWITRIFATIGISLPSFVISALLIYFFSVKLKWFPATGLTTPKHYVLPVIALSLGSVAYITRLMRSNMLDALSQDYVRTARAKGVPEWSVVAKHALRNSILPIVAYFGTLATAMLTGSFIVEKMFAIPGIGMNYVNSISNRDYAVIMGLTIFFAFVLMICNIVGDIVQAIVDPRIRYS